jgi:ribose transport system substrate-binding protein
MRSAIRILALCGLGSTILAGSALADTSAKKIAFSNNSAGNSWRQAMLKSYDIVTKKAVADKVVGAADVFTTADKEVPTQAAQIQNLILQGYDAIVINASSPDALNGAIKQACDAGIVVVSFDGIVTEPCAYRVVVDFKDMGKQEVEQMAKFQPKGGNLLEIRGLAGTSIDDAIHAGILEGVKAHPEFKIVASVTAIGINHSAEGRRHGAVFAARRDRRGRSGRRWLWGGPGVRRRQQAAADHYHGQSPG